MSKRRLLLVGIVLAVVAGLAIVKPDAPLRMALREWRVVSMSGFPSEPISDASFRFVGDEIRLNDGANSMNFRIDWSGSRFRVEEALITTAVGLPEGTSTFADMFKVGEVVEVDPGWKSATLTRGGMTVTARS